MTSKKEKATERAESIAALRKMLRPGMTVYTVLRHSSASGMSRVIDVVIAYRDTRDVYPLGADGRRDYDAKPRRVANGIKARSIGWHVARAIGERWDGDRWGIRVTGCGMDMGFHVVYSLGRTLWPDGFKLRPGMRGRNGDTSGFDRDGGYALRHEWL